MHLMHHAAVFNQADACASLATHVRSVHAICADRLALCGYNDRKVQSVQQAALSFEFWPLYAVHCADLEIVHKARYIVESSSCVKKLGPCEVLPRLDLILEDYECTLQTTSLAVFLNIS